MYTTALSFLGLQSSLLNILTMSTPRGIKNPMEAHNRIPWIFISNIKRGLICIIDHAVSLISANRHQKKPKWKNNIERHDLLLTLWLSESCLMYLWGMMRWFSLDEDTTKGRRSSARRIADIVDRTSFLNPCIVITSSSSSTVLHFYIDFVRYILLSLDMCLYTIIYQTSWWANDFWMR